MDANGALLLAAAGFLLICAEFCLPGWVVPGVAGGVCLIYGGYRLAGMESSLLSAAGITAAVLLVLLAGYGVIPNWIGWVALAVLPWLCRVLVPGSISWPAAVAAAAAPAAAFLLLRVASRAWMNKTLVE